VDAFQVGSLIALYERAVGFYASLINTNAYHQPGVEAGKKAATEILDLQLQILAHLKNNPAAEFSAEAIATALGADTEDCYHILTHLAANSGAISHSTGNSPADDRFTHQA
jgi:glucose-6-phosphate isomerase